MVALTHRLETILRDYCFVKRYVNDRIFCFTCLFKILRKYITNLLQLLNIFLVIHTAWSLCISMCILISDVESDHFQLLQLILRVLGRLQRSLWKRMNQIVKKRLHIPPSNFSTIQLLEMCNRFSLQLIQSLPKTRKISCNCLQ